MTLRMKQIHKTFLIAMLVFCALLLDYNVSFADAPVRITLLEDDFGARAFGMGGAFVGLADDANTILCNPAGLAYVTASEMSMMYLNGLLDTKEGFIGYVHPLKKLGLGISAATYDGGVIEVNYTNGTSKKFKAESNFLGSLALSGSVNKMFSFGITGKIIKTKLVEQYSDTAYALDLGGLYKAINDRFSIGASVLNLGTPISYRGKVKESLPIRIKLGLASKICDSFTNTVLACAGFEQEIGAGSCYSLGFEYWLNELVALRLGYRTGYEPNSFTVGFGLNPKGNQLDYCWAAKGDLGNTHRISFTTRFGVSGRYKKGEGYYSKGMTEKALYQWSKVPQGHRDYVKAQEKIKLCKGKVEELAKLKEEQKRRFAEAQETERLHETKVSPPAPIKENYLIDIRVMEEIPTAIYYLFEDKDISVINVQIVNNTNKPATFKVSYRIEGKTGKETKRDIVVEKEDEVKINVNPSLLPEDIKLINSRTPAIILVRVERVTETGESKLLAEDFIRTTLCPYDQFFPQIKDAKGESFDLLDTLDSWVTFNDRNLNEVFAKASDRGSKLKPPVKIVGFQPPEIFTRFEDKRTLEQRDKDYLAQINLIYDTLREDYRITYLNQPIAYKSSQRIKLPFATLKGKGNCIELAILFASLLESIEIKPILVLLPQDGHAVVGWKVPAEGKEICHLLETNVFGENFEKVVTRGKKWIDEYELETEFENGIPFDENGVFKKDVSVIILDVKKIRDRIPPSPYHQ